MSRQPKPWYRADRKVWCVTINGKRHNLGRKKKEAFEQFFALMQKPRKREAVAETTLPALVDAFLEWNFQNRAEATYGWYRERLQSFVSCYPEITIETLKPFHVENWATAPHRTVNTRRNLMRAVKRCLRWACSQGYLETNPLAQMEIPNGRPRDTYVPPDEYQSLLRLVSDPCFASLLRVTYETGCRPQESLRVEARHVDLEHSRWVFPADEAKVKSMPRIVYMTEYGLKISKELIAKWPDGPLFRNTMGKPWTPNSVGCVFERLLIKIGKAKMKELEEAIDEKTIARHLKSLKPERVSQGVSVKKTKSELRCEAKRKLINERARQLGVRYSLYSLRHSWATNALKKGVDALTVAILMGHKDPSQLARTYQHLGHNPDHMLKQARKAAE